MSLSHSAKRDRLTWSLLALFLALLSIIVFLQRTTANDMDAHVRSVDDITRIVIERTDYPDTVLELEEEDRWWVTSPVRIAANDQRILPLLTVYTNPDPGYDIDSVDLVATGLQDPEIEVAFNRYRVAIGNKALDESKRHALHGERVRFVPDWVLPLLQGGVSAVADLRVFGDALDALSFTSAGEPLNGQALEQARELTAQQFVAWPLAEPATVLSTRKAMVTVAGVNTEWTLTETDRYIAMVRGDSDYAFIVSRNEAPWFEN